MPVLCKVLSYIKLTLQERRYLLVLSNELAAYGPVVKSLTLTNVTVLEYHRTSDLRAMIDFKHAKERNRQPRCGYEQLTLNLCQVLVDENIQYIHNKLLDKFSCTQVDLQKQDDLNLFI